MSDSGDCVLSGLVLTDEDVGSASCQFVNGAVKGLLISSSQDEISGHICCGDAKPFQVCMSRDWLWGGLFGETVQ